MTTGLTDRQTECLGVVRAFIAEHSTPPTLRDIGAVMGIKSSNGVNDHLRALERKGYVKLGIEGKMGSSRAIRLTSAHQRCCPMCGQEGWSK